MALFSLRGLERFGWMWNLRLRLSGTNCSKANSKIRIKSAEIRDLKGQIAKLSKIKFGVNSDRNPEKGKAKMDNNADDKDGWGRKTARAAKKS